MTPAEAKHALWMAGDLSYLLHETQERMREAICRSTALLFVLNCARRLGKSFLCCVLALEMCLQKPGARVLYIAPTAKQVRTIITPIMRDLLRDCPQGLLPSFTSMDGIWKFPNGSEIHIVGVNNNHADDARGGGADFVIVDEAGMIDELDYLIESVIKPMLLVTNGRIVMLSTPAKTPAHPFTAYCARAAAATAYAGYTIKDAPHISEERRERFIEESGGRDSTTVRRELFCEHVVDTEIAIYPEFGEHVVEERERPPHFVPVISGDAGFHDQTFVIGGFHDFLAGVDVIEWEWVGEKTLARDIDAGVSAAGYAHWGEQRTRAARRHIDAPPQVVAELCVNGSVWSGIAKTTTDGPFMAAAVNGVRTRMVKPHPTLRINPRCTRLIAQCRVGVWKETAIGHDFARMPGFGHFDGCAALAYFDRVVDRRTNPYPSVKSSGNFVVFDEPDTQHDRLRRLARGARGRA